MYPRLVLGIDPGGGNESGESTMGTGWCLIQVESDLAKPAMLNYGHIIGGPREFLGAFDRDDSFKAAQAASTEICVEGFTKLIAAAKIGPLEIVGMVEMLGYLAGKRVTVSRPGARTAVSHADLKRTGFWPGGFGHADTAQAIRHVLSMLIREGHRGTAMLLVPPPQELTMPNSQMLVVDSSKLDPRAPKASDLASGKPLSGLW